MGAYSNSKVLLRRRFPGSDQELAQVSLPNSLLKDNQPTEIGVNIDESKFFPQYNLVENLTCFSFFILDQWQILHRWISGNIY